MLRRILCALLWSKLTITLYHPEIVTNSLWNLKIVCMLRMGLCRTNSQILVSVLNCRFWLMLMVKFRLCSLITFDRSTFNILLCAFSRLSVTGCGSEWHRGDRERLAVDQQSQARGGEPGQAVAGARNGNPGRKYPFFCFLRCLRPGVLPEI